MLAAASTQPVPCQTRRRQAGKAKDNVVVKDGNYLVTVKTTKGWQQRGVRASVEKLSRRVWKRASRLEEEEESDFSLERRASFDQDLPH